MARSGSMGCAYLCLPGSGQQVTRARPAGRGQPPGAAGHRARPAAFSCSLLQAPVPCSREDGPPYGIEGGGAGSGMRGEREGGFAGDAADVCPRSPRQVQLVLSSPSPHVGSVQPSQPRAIRLQEDYTSTTCHTYQALSVMS